MEEKIKIIKIIYLIIIGLIVFFLLILHTFSLFSVTVNTTSILLLVMLLILPLVPNLKKIKWGDFEVETILAKTEKGLKKIETGKELTQNYLEQMKKFSVEEPELKKKLSIPDLEAQIDILLSQLAELQRQLAGVEIRNEGKRKKVEGYKSQIDTLLSQLAELQRQLIELENKNRSGFN